MRPFHAVRLEPEELHRDIDHTQLESSILRLRAHFRRCGRILPKPDESIIKTWASTPNKIILSRSLNGNVVSPTPRISSRCSREQLDPNLEARLRPLTSDPHNFIVYRDVHIDAPPLPTTDASIDPIVSPDYGHMASSAPDNQAPTNNAPYEYYLSSLARSVVPPTTPSPSVVSIPLSRANSQDSNSHFDTTILRLIHKQMVLESLSILNTEGPKAVVSTLLERGVRDYESAIPVVMAICTLQKNLSRRKPDIGRELACHLRFCAVGIFQEYWKAPLAWKFTNELSKEHTHLIIKAVNVAGLMGSLFTVGIVTANDLHRCLERLIDGTVEFGHVCAMHALIVQANNKLCKSETAPFIKQFRDMLSDRFLNTDLVETRPSRFLVEVEYCGHY